MIKILIAIIVPIMITFALIFKEEIISLSQAFPKCQYYEKFGIYCVGCGCTRSVICLLHGDILSSFRNNPAPIFFSAILMLLYIELILNITGTKIKLVPRGNWFIYISLIVMMGFYIIRNFIPLLQPIS